MRCKVNVLLTRITLLETDHVTSKETIIEGEKVRVVVVIRSTSTVTSGHKPLIVRLDVVKDLGVTVVYRTLVFAPSEGHPVSVGSIVLTVTW